MNEVYCTEWKSQVHDIMTTVCTLCTSMTAKIAGSVDGKDRRYNIMLKKHAKFIPEMSFWGI